MHFSPASDAVLEANRFRELAGFIRFTKTSLNIVKLSFLISFLYNIIGISFAITGNLSPIIATRAISRVKGRKFIHQS